MHHPSRLERAQRRLRAAEALTADLRQAVEDEGTLAPYLNTESARAASERYGHAVADLEQARARKASTTDLGDRAGRQQSATP